MKTLIFYGFLFGIQLGFSQGSSINGTVNAKNSPVAFANIYVEQLQKGTTSDQSGYFRLKNLPSEKIQLRISAVGFKTEILEINLSDKTSTALKIELQEDQQQLSEIQIVDKQTGLTRKTPYTISSLQMNDITTKGDPNGMMGSLRKIPGVYGSEFGQGIVKPFIRGLGFSRVVTVYQGNKLENHQWGADHGLGVNDLGVSRVEVIKGPASVLYGSGALGGVILVKDEENYLNHNRFTGNFGLTYNSVSNGMRAYTSLGKKWKNGFFLATNTAYETHADYKNGNNRIIGNSRYNMASFRLHTGLKKENFNNKLSFSVNDQSLGIISDEEMEHSLVSSRNDRKMQLPYQEVSDYLLSYNQHTKHQNLETSLHLSHHFNDRAEIETAQNLVDLGIQQSHTFYNGRITFPGKFSHNFGIQGSFIKTKNQPEALEFLIPDAQAFENGLYYMAKLDLDSWFLQGALRYDYRSVTADASKNHFINYGFVLPGGPENRQMERNFDGFTGSFGASKKLNDLHRLKLNFSTGYRAPDLAELFSYGPHPGTSRFEQGNTEFEREQSLQVDLGYSYQKNNFRAEVSVFGSLVNNYLFFSDTGERRAKDDLQIWAYQQTLATLYGFEFNLQNSWWHNRLQLKLNGALVRGRDRENDMNLSFVPPDNLNAEMDYFTLADKSLQVFSKIRLINRQNRPGLNEMATNGYILLNLGVSKAFQWGKNTLKTGMQIQNTLNKNYVDHMSVLRAFEISSPGRNFMLNVNYAF